MFSVLPEAQIQNFQLQSEHQVKLWESGKLRGTGKRYKSLVRSLSHEVGKTEQQIKVRLYMYTTIIQLIATMLNLYRTTSKESKKAAFGG